MKQVRAATLVFLVALLFSASFAQTAQTATNAVPCPQHLHFRVTLPAGAADHSLSGRLIVLLSKNTHGQMLEPGFGADTRSTWSAAEEVQDLAPGATIDLDPDHIAFPAPLSAAPAGKYYAAAVLDVHHDYTYRGLSPGDLYSSTVELSNLNPAAAEPVNLSLTQIAPQQKIVLPSGAELIDFISPSLSKFWGRPIHMRGIAVLPPSYPKTKHTYPTVYTTHGFGGTLENMASYVAPQIAAAMNAHTFPEMIYVLLDESFPTGTHEFADSVNNGPWGHALTAELIPYLEHRYRMDAKPRGRFLTGHSSGGWATLWLQVNYPRIFGGTWSTSPDPSDFHSFTGPDIASNPPQNVYHKSDGSPWMLVRMGGKDVESLEDLARQEDVLGTYGGQMRSFEYVFSPRAPNGTPMELFDRKTGAVDPEVARYWEEHYDIAALVRRNWLRIGPSLKGKIHLIVGTADTFHLDEPARLLQRTLDELGANAKFTYLEGRTHFDLYQGGLSEKIAKEMFAVARPHK